MRKTLACILISAVPLMSAGCSEWALGTGAVKATASALEQMQVDAQLAAAAATDKQEANKQLFTYSPEVEQQLKELRATMKEQQKVAAAQWKAAGIKSRTTPSTRPTSKTVSGSLFR
jgi:multidrug efflux pump subunit AcrA (membrane-fusion protein)